MCFWDYPPGLDGGVLAMHAGGGGEGAAADGDGEDAADSLRVGRLFEEANLDAWGLLEVKPGGVTWDEYAWYIINDNLSPGQIDTLIDEGPDEIQVTQWHGGETALAVAMILYHENIGDVDVDDIMLNTPEDTTPTDFARACSLMGAEARARILGDDEEESESEN